MIKKVSLYKLLFENLQNIENLLKQAKILSDEEPGNEDHLNLQKTIRAQLRSMPAAEIIKLIKQYENSDFSPSRRFNFSIWDGVNQALVSKLSQLSLKGLIFIATFKSAKMEEYLGKIGGYQFYSLVAENILQHLFDTADEDVISNIEKNILPTIDPKEYVYTILSNGVSKFKRNKEENAKYSMKKS